MTKRKIKNLLPLQCNVCEEWWMPTYPNQTADNFVCCEDCRDLRRTYCRQPIEAVRVHHRRLVKEHKIWASFCLPTPDITV